MPIWLFEFGQYIGAALLSLVVFLLMGLALLPAYCLVDWTYLTFGVPAALVSMPVAYLLWGTTFCLEVIIAKRYVLFYKAREGQFPFISWNVIGWAVMGYVILIANTTFMQFFRGTPFMNMWLTALGAKIGRRVNVQTTFITDWDLVTLEDDVVLGGDCHIACHMLEGETLRFAPITISKKALVGQTSTLLPGVTVGEGGIIGARSIVTKGTTTEARSIYAGVPAKLIRIRDEKKKSQS
ncbi:MAG: hypothetical protein GY822_04425 [Deltaproteobacteria bacterium]|nr:hypothetical protein [Deltaproteobacteria bacterium]